MNSKKGLAYLNEQERVWLHGKQMPIYKQCSTSYGYKENNMRKCCTNTAIWVECLFMNSRKDASLSYSVPESHSCSARTRCCSFLSFPTCSLRLSFSDEVLLRLLRLERRPVWEYTSMKIVQKQSTSHKS